MAREDGCFPEVSFRYVSEGLTPLPKAGRRAGLLGVDTRARFWALGPRWFEPNITSSFSRRLPNTPRHPGRTGAYACPTRVPWNNSEAVVPLLYNDFRYSTKSDFCWLLKPRLNLLS